MQFHITNNHFLSFIDNNFSNNPKSYKFITINELIHPLPHQRVHRQLQSTSSFTQSSEEILKLMIPDDIPSTEVIPYLLNKNHPLQMPFVTSLSLLRFTNTFITIFKASLPPFAKRLSQNNLKIKSSSVPVSKSS